MDREKAVAQVVASVFHYVDGGWQPRGRSSIGLYHNASTGRYRVVAYDGNKAVTINSSLTGEVVYREASETFHQWSDGRTIYGVNFADVPTAQQLATAMSSAITELKGGSGAASAAAPPPAAAPKPAPVPPKPASDTPPAGNTGNAMAELQAKLAMRAPGDAPGGAAPPPAAAPKPAPVPPKPAPTPAAAPPPANQMNELQAALAAREDKPAPAPALSAPPPDDVPPSPFDAPPPDDEPPPPPVPAGVAAPAPKPAPIPAKPAPKPGSKPPSPSSPSPPKPLAAASASSGGSADSGEIMAAIDACRDEIKDVRAQVDALKDHFNATLATLRDEIVYALGGTPMSVPVGDIAFEGV